MNARLEPFERVSFLVIVQESWTIGNGLITPTLKIKRTAVEVRYASLVEEWKSYNSTVIWESSPSAASSIAS
jgi:long-chain acyl-CoA synthetase